MQNGTVLFAQQERSRWTKYILGLQPVTHAANFTSLSPPSASHPEVSDASASGKLLSARRDTRASVRLDPEVSTLSVILCQTQKETTRACAHSCVEAGISDLVKVGHQKGMSRGWEGCEVGRMRRGCLMRSRNSCQHSVVRYSSYLTLNCLFQIPGRDEFENFQHKETVSV